MRPKNLQTKIFLDSGNPEDTREALALLGFLDGQTTNPSLFAKSPTVKAQLASGKKFTQAQVFEAYKDIITEIREILPHGSISIEVPADTNTSAEEMIRLGKELSTWTTEAHIKLPTTTAGLEAAEQLTIRGIPVNMTLVFSEAQAAAVYAATKHRTEGTSVFVSPFVGRLDDRGENGMDLILHILDSYRTDGEEYLSVLAASIRSLDHFLAAIAFGSDIVTVPLSILKEWAEAGMPVPDDSFIYASDLEDMPYQDVKLDGHWRDYDIAHELTDVGLAKFAKDWNSLVE